MGLRRSNDQWKYRIIRSIVNTFSMDMMPVYEKAGFGRFWGGLTDDKWEWDTEKLVNATLEELQIVRNLMYWSWDECGGYEENRQREILMFLNK